ncbi:type II toxin-antitoxin system PemK/MazF family toxin [Herbiconiux solani]|uniref:type II toxin-antitoxin system PemK/MazF family toxin n=1 Tax=Herbiconiux solani TaxID=661329 RepID=UPI00082628A1|nr:type II toxin-antitoxin system PemK/MazF family toxin [Herbiconiux solani]
MVIARGEIWWSQLGEPQGSEPGGRRPVLIIQSDAFNRSAIATCIVVSVTSNTSVAGHPGNVFVPSSASGLPRDSVVNVSQVATVDRAVLVARAGSLPAYLLEEVERGMRVVLDV